MAKIDDCAINLPNGSKVKVHTTEAFWQAIDESVIFLLRLPDGRLKKRLRDAGGKDDDPIVKRMARLLAELIIPYEIEQCCALLVAVPAFFDEYVAYRGDGSMRLRNLFTWCVEDGIRDYLKGQWSGYLVQTNQTPQEREAKGKGPLDSILKPPVPPDPYQGWTTDRWIRTYASASLQEKPKMRSAAAHRGIESDTWPGVAHELRERYRISNESEGYSLRLEAQHLGLSTDLWNRWEVDEPLPVDTEKLVREQLLQELCSLPPLDTLEAYCELLVTYAIRAKQAAATELWQAFRAMVGLWIEVYDQGTEALLQIIRDNGMVYWQHPDNVQNLQFLADYEVGLCMQEILQQHFLRSDEEG